MNKLKGFINIILIIAIAIALFISGTYLVVHQKISLPFYHQNPNPVACTQEAMQCPDGSYVGRTGPNCEFTKCPIINPAPVVCEYPAPPSGCTYIEGPNYNQQTACGAVLSCQNPTPNGNQIVFRENQREDSLLVQKIYPTYITGLNFLEYPVATSQGQAITLHIGETVSNGCTVTFTLVSIQNNTATFNKKTDFNKPCPICLAENTLINTPNGPLAIQELKIGMPIWTIDEFGKAMVTKIIKTSRTPVESHHSMVHIILNDKREIFASPGHPIGDGRVFNDLSGGDILDGSNVVAAQKVSYDKGYTYDILPSGKTGLYFANGILIDSTLH